MKRDVKDLEAVTAGPMRGLPQMRSIKDVARMATDTDLSPAISNTPKRAVRTLLHIKTNIIPLGREEKETIRHRQGQSQTHPKRIATEDNINSAATASTMIQGSQDRNLASEKHNKAKTTIKGHKKHRKPLHNLKLAQLASLKNK